MSIEVTLNGLVFEIPTRGERSWDDLTNWCLEVNETLQTISGGTVISNGTANLIDGSPVNLYTVNTPQDNSHIIFEYGIYRKTSGSGATSLSVTGQLMLSYNATTGVWTLLDQANGDSSVTFTISSNTIRATATAISGAVVDTSVIFYQGRIITV